MADTETGDQAGNSQPIKKKLPNHKTLINVTASKELGSKNGRKPTEHLSEIAKRMEQNHSKTEGKSKKHGDDNSAPNGKSSSANFTEKVDKDAMSAKGNNSKVSNGVNQVVPLHSKGASETAETTHMVSTVSASADKTETKVEVVTADDKNTPKSSSGTLKILNNSKKSSTTPSNQTGDIAIVQNGEDRASCMDLYLDSMNTLRDFDSVLEIISSQTNVSVPGNTTSESSDFTEPQQQSGIDGGYEIVHDTDPQSSYEGQTHTSKSPPPVAPKRVQKDRKSHKQKLEKTQPVEQLTKYSKTTETAHLKDKDPKINTDNSDSTTDDALPKAPPRNHRTPSDGRGSPNTKSNYRRPASEIFWTSPSLSEAQRGASSPPPVNTDESSSVVSDKHSTEKTKSPTESGNPDPGSSPPLPPTTVQPKPSETIKTESNKATTSSSKPASSQSNRQDLPAEQTSAKNDSPTTEPKVQVPKIQITQAAPSEPASKNSVEAKSLAGVGGEQQQQLACYNHAAVIPQRYCNNHHQAICLECAFELHRTCRDVEVLDAAAKGRRMELEQMCESLLMLRAEWEGLLSQLGQIRARMGDEKVKTLAAIQKMVDVASQVIKSKGEQLAEEAELLYAKEEEESVTREDRVRRALDSLQEVQAQGEMVLTSGGQAGLLRQFGKLKSRCEALIETDVMDAGEILDCVKVTSTWFDDVKLLPPAKLTLETRRAVAKKNMHMSERGLETFRRISKKRRQNVLPDMYREDRLVSPPVRSPARASRLSLARSVASTGSLPSMLSSQSMGFLEGPQSMFEFYAGQETDKYPFGLGDICVMQPRLTILITYLTSDLLRVFPWREESSAFVSEPLECTLCCITQLTNETVAVTSSNSDQLSIMKVETDRVHLAHSVSMKRQYRAITSLDYRTVALATDSKKSGNNVIVIVRFDSSDYRSFTHLKTISARSGSVPIIKFLSKTLFKVPYSMCMSSNGHIIVSDSENKALLALHQDGEKRWVFQPPKQSRVIDTPGGVACSPSGYLYLVDSCEQRILRFDRTGKFRKVVLSQEDGLEWPIGVACADDSTLCVAEFYGQVKVFRVR